MSLKCLGVVLLLGLVAAKIPSYLKVCGRRNPKVNECVVEAVFAIRNKFHEGMPELGLPSIDPLYLNFLPLFESDAITIYAYDAVIFGLSNLNVKSVNMDFGQKTINVSSTFNRTSFASEYEMKAKIVVPMEGRGSVRIDGDDVNLKISANYELVKKDNDDYIHFTSLKTQVNARNCKAEFKPLKGSVDVAVTTMMKIIMRDDDQEILEAMMPVVENTISVEMLKVANAIAMLVPFDEYFPDTE